MRPTHLVTLLVLLALAVASAPAPAHAGVVVSVCDEDNLLAALAAGSPVTFSCSGTITLTAEIVIAADTSIDGSGQTVTLSGNHAVRVFTVNSGVTLNLNRLTVADGSAIYGGGIYNEGGTLNVNNSTFSGNTAGGAGFNSKGGGGIYNSRYGTLTVSNSTFSGNSAGDYSGGGGIDNYIGTVSVNNSTFSGNSAIRGGGIHSVFGTLTVSNSTFSGNSTGAFVGNGGGITLDGGTLTVNNSTFSGNSANVGGSIYNSDFGAVEVSNSTFSGNDAFASGGGIWNNYDGALTVSNSTFSGNSANSGGGIYNGNGGTVSVSNSTFSANSARFGGDGGGIFNRNGTLNVSNSTFYDNTAGGGLGGAIGNHAAVTLQNTIVANSLTGNNCYGTITDGGGNLSYPDTTCPGINSNPVLGPLQNNGGPTHTMALGPGSAALDAANDAICAAPPVNNLDQRGIGRPQGPHCDIGAYEVAPHRTYLPMIIR